MSVALVFGCFADPPAGGSDAGGSDVGSSDESTGGIATTETSDDGDSTMGSVGGSTTPGDSSTSDDGGSSSAADTSGDSSSGDVDTFCDTVPATTEICRDFDGDVPLVDWTLLETHGEVTWTSDVAFSPPNALMTSTTPAGGNQVSTATASSSTDGLPLPVSAAIIDVQLWIDDDCFATTETRSAIQLVWGDGEDPDGPSLYTLTFSLAEDRVVVAESDEPYAVPSIDEESMMDVAAGEWLPVRVDFSLPASIVVITVDGITFPVLLNLPDQDLLEQIDDVPLVIALGQAAQAQPACAMLYDSFTVDLQ